MCVHDSQSVRWFCLFMRTFHQNTYRLVRTYLWGDLWCVLTSQCRSTYQDTNESLPPFLCMSDNSYLNSCVFVCAFITAKVCVRWFHLYMRTFYEIPTDLWGHSMFILWWLVLQIKSVETLTKMLKYLNSSMCVCVCVCVLKCHYCKWRFSHGLDFITLTVLSITFFGQDTEAPTHRHT